MNVYVCLFLHFACVCGHDIHISAWKCSCYFSGYMAVPQCIPYLITFMLAQRTIMHRVNSPVAKQDRRDNYAPCQQPSCQIGPQGQLRTVSTAQLPNRTAGTIMHRVNSPLAKQDHRDNYAPCQQPSCQTGSQRNSSVRDSTNFLPGAGNFFSFCTLGSVR